MIKQLLGCLAPADSVVLGGTLGKGDYDLEPRESDTAGILARCTAVMPSLKAAKLEKVWVSLVAWGNVWSWCGCCLPSVVPHYQ